MILTPLLLVCFAVLKSLRPDLPPLDPIVDHCLDNLPEEEPAVGAPPLVANGAGATRGLGQQPDRSSSSSSSTTHDGSSPPVLEDEPVVYQVCMSPGCLADGARHTYDKLVALAPPHVQVQAGSCHSLCGNGPVVDAHQKRLRKVSGPKVLDLLQQERGVVPELVEGYDLVLEGDAAFAKAQYDEAIALYSRAVQVSFRAALDWQAARERLHKPKGSSTTTSQSSSSTTPLEWLVRARRNTATALLHQDDLESALLEAQAACNLSRNTCWKSVRVVAEIYKRKGDLGGECATLHTLFALPVDESTLEFAAQNDRRELQFRLQRLEKELRQQHKPPT